MVNTVMSTDDGHDADNDDNDGLLIFMAPVMIMRLMIVMLMLTY